MYRSILAIVVGYVTLAVIVMAGFSVALLAPQLAFQSDSLSVTKPWLAYVLLVSLLSALTGGFVCKCVGDRDRAVTIFAVIVLALGIGQAIANSQKTATAIPLERIVAMSVMEKAQVARQPDWYSWVLPIVAFGGIFLGGRLRR